MAASPEAPSDAHEWVSFEDPSEERTWVVDVTFLASYWQCIYGNGCQGVLTGPAPERMEGCCSYGAHFTGEEDVARVAAAAQTLSAEEWQFRGKGRRKSGVFKRDAKGGVTTRLVDGACIFLNRPGHAGGAGCALHRGGARAWARAPRAQTRRLLAAAPPPRGHRGTRRERDELARRMGPASLGRGRRRIPLVVHRGARGILRPGPCLPHPPRRDRRHGGTAGLRPGRLVSREPVRP